jgi:hypothetical protein
MIHAFENFFRRMQQNGTTFKLLLFYQFLYSKNHNFEQILYKTCTSIIIQVFRMLP